MRRLAGLAVLAAVSLIELSATAQEGTVRRVAALMPFTEGDAEGQRRVGALERGLGEAGWKIGTNLRIDYRWAGDDRERIREYAAELVGLKPDAILVSTALTLAPVQQLTKSIPIVFTHITDPVGAGVVASLAHPGGNVTGFTPGEFSIYGKLLELLRETVPAIARVAVIANPEQAPQHGMVRAVEAAAQRQAVEVSVISVRDDIGAAIAIFARTPASALIVLPNPVADRGRSEIAELAAKHRLPAIYAYRYFVLSGGLMSYGVETVELSKQSARYVARILRGAKPGDLPVQHPTKFELVVSLKTAKALGIDVPRTILERADEVIE
jgi:putative ABC transport system substrate-binding protein